MKNGNFQILYMRVENKKEGRKMEVFYPAFLFPVKSSLAYVVFTYTSSVVSTVKGYMRGFILLCDTNHGKDINKYQLTSDDRMRK